MFLIDFMLTCWEAAVGRGCFACLVYAFICQYPASTADKKPVCPCLAARIVTVAGDPVSNTILVGSFFALVPRGSAKGLGMSSAVASKMWSTDTLECGIAHVAGEADLAYLEAEEHVLQLEMEDPPSLVVQHVPNFFPVQYATTTGASAVVSKHAGRCLDETNIVDLDMLSIYNGQSSSKSGCRAGVHGCPDALGRVCCYTAGAWLHDSVSVRLLRISLKLSQATAKELMQTELPDDTQPDTLVDEFDSAASLHDLGCNGVDVTPRTSMVLFVYLSNRGYGG